MKTFAFLAPSVLVLASCIQNPTPSAKAESDAAKERLETQNERLTRLETELHEMRLLFTSQLKRIEEVAHQSGAAQQQIPAQAQQQPQQVVIMPQTPVVTHRWEEESAPRSFNGPVRGSSAHTIQPGDTLSEIAAQYGISLSSLMTANPGTDPLRLKVGKKLRIPTDGQGSTATHFQPRSGAFTHTVQAGDTLSEIAGRHGISLASLLANNPGLDPDRLRIGSRVEIPQNRIQPTSPVSEPIYHQPERREIVEAPVPPAPASAAPSRMTQPGSKLFVRVPRSKTLAEIALDFHTDVETLNQLNLTTLSPNHRIPANATLYVPAD